MSEFHYLSIGELTQKYHSGELDCSAATEAALQRIESTKHLNAYLAVDAAGARQQARAADQRYRSGAALSPLDGVGVGLKDIILTEGLVTTCASKMLENFVPPYDATVTTKLKEAGAVLLGKLNMDEFAMGSSNEHSAFGAVRNPWSTQAVPGGSSGGSAAAVACGSAVVSLGTDTGGSIRQPAALTGIVGLKPTYGRVSRYGVIAFASSLDQVGPMARNVTDCAQLLSVIAGHDPKDSTSADVPVPDYLATLEEGVAGLKIGIPKEYFVEGLSTEVRDAVEAAMHFYERCGASIVEVSLPHTEYAIATYYLICTAEASSNLARYDGVRYGLRDDPGAGLHEMYKATRAHFGSEVKRRIILGTYALSAGYYDAYYLRAQKVRTLIKQDFSRAFDTVDVLLAPTTPKPAFALGQASSDPLSLYLADVFTVSCNLAGLPGLSLPCGFSAEGLPMGMQLIGKPWDEATLLRVGRAYEREHSWHEKRPPL